MDLTSKAAESQAQQSHSEPTEKKKEKENQDSLRKATEILRLSVSPQKLTHTRDDHCNPQFRISSWIAVAGVQYLFE